ncbi:MAG: restriction endonuclease [Granulosicoccus sp.]|nr:restriction endonuclease [Granulosicoccus sp.]
MAFKMAEGSLFAVLMRSPWWYSVLIGLSIIVISLALIGGNYGILFTALSLPFFVVAGLSAHKQSKLPSQKRMLEVIEEARTMSAIQIADKIAETYTKVRFDRELFKGKAAELELIRGNRKILLCSKRFKAANTGIEPLKQLVAAGEKVEATGYLYVVLGELSANAISYANENDIELVQSDRLAAFFDGQATIN